MANISDAHGIITITIGTTDQKSVDTFVSSLTEILESFNYSTDLDLSGTITNDETTTLEFYFIGRGRWTYEKNAEDMWKWVSTVDYPALFDEISIDTTIEYSEIEFGMDFMAMGEIKHEKPAHTPIAESVVIKSESESEEISVSRMSIYDLEDDGLIDYSEEGLTRFFAYADEYEYTIPDEIKRFTPMELASMLVGSVNCVANVDTECPCDVETFIEELKNELN